MILILNQGRYDTPALCNAYDRACQSLKYKTDEYAPSFTPRFRELDDIIQSEIKRTGGSAYIHYDSWTKDRIDLLKKVKKQMMEK